MIIEITVMETKMSVQSLRRGKGWSQEDLALHAGVSARTIQRIEAGHAASLETLKCLAAVLETSVSDLITESDAMNTTPEKDAAARLSTQEASAISWVKNLRAFHLHWISYPPVMGILLILNHILIQEMDIIILIGSVWAGAIVLHAAILFGFFGLFGAQWEQREFRKRLGR